MNKKIDYIAIKKLCAKDLDKCYGKFIKSIKRTMKKHGMRLHGQYEDEALAVADKLMFCHDDEPTGKFEFSDLAKVYTKKH